LSNENAIKTGEYLLSRLTSWFGNRPDYFSSFMDRNVGAYGWLPAEAYYALSGPVSSLSVDITAVRGNSQGEGGFSPDIEINIDNEAHQVAVVPALVTPDKNLTTLVGEGLGGALEWASGIMKDRAIVYLLAFPSGIETEDWASALSKSEEKYQLKALDSMQFVIPRPPREMSRGTATVLIHSSRL
jgi:hypothetical protein